MPNALPDDESKLQQSLDLLIQQGYLEYTGEYGAELTTFIPFVAWLNREGWLDQRRIITYQGMRPYYYFLTNEQFQDKKTQRFWLADQDRYWPSSSTYTATASRWHVYPNYRQHYQDSGEKFDKPIIFIQNKFIIEWHIGPINYLPLILLRRFLIQTKDAFTVIYSRPTKHINRTGFSIDENYEIDYPDRAILSEFKHTIDLESFCSEQELDYNTTKLKLMAQAHIFVGVQGGGAHAIAYFDHSLLLLLHHIDYLGQREQYEYPHAYKYGPYKYLNHHSLTLAVACNLAELDAGLFGLSHISIDHQKRMTLSGQALSSLKPLIM